MNRDMIDSYRLSITSIDKQIREVEWNILNLRKSYEDIVLPSEEDLESYKISYGKFSKKLVELMGNKKRAIDNFDTYLKEKMDKE